MNAYLPLRNPDEFRLTILIEIRNRRIPIGHPVFPDHVARHRPRRRTRHHVLVSIPIHIGNDAHRPIIRIIRPRSTTPLPRSNSPLRIQHNPTHHDLRRTIPIHMSNRRRYAVHRLGIRGLTIRQCRSPIQRSIGSKRNGSASHFRCHDLHHPIAIQIRRRWRSPRIDFIARSIHVRRRIPFFDPCLAIERS